MAVDGKTRQKEIQGTEGREGKGVEVGPKKRADALQVLGDVLLGMDRDEEAMRKLDESVAMYNELEMSKSRNCAVALQSMGEGLLETGKCQEAIGKLQESVNIYNSIGMRRSRGCALALRSIQRTQGQIREGSRPARKCWFHIKLDDF